MSDYTYELPFTNEQFLKGIRREIKRHGETQLFYHLKKSKLSIDELGTSYYVNGSGRWDAIGINIKFYTNPSYLDMVDNDTYRSVLYAICDNLIPAEVGYDLKSVIFCPDLSIDECF